MFKIIKMPALIYFNSSKSLPIGFYVKVPFETPLKISDLVIVKLPVEMHEYVYQRNWLKKDTPLLKTVYALPGDTYSINDEAVFVNGKYAGAISTKDKSGLPLPQIRGVFTVEDGHFLPMAVRFPDSFDGRYFGQINQKLIIAQVKPLFIFPNWLEAITDDS